MTGGGYGKFHHLPSVLHCDATATMQHDMHVCQPDVPIDSITQPLATRIARRFRTDSFAVRI